MKVVLTNRLTAVHIELPQQTRLNVLWRLSCKRAPSFRLALVLLLVACAGRARSSDRDRNVIRADEIASVQVTTAYDIVARLRGEFLRPRGTVTRSPAGTSQRPTQEQPTITVFIDDVEAGPADRTLHAIPASEVFEIRLYRAADAATKYGSRHNGGVIAITTKRLQL